MKVSINFAYLSFSSPRSYRPSPFQCTCLSPAACRRDIAHGVASIAYFIQYFFCVPPAASPIRVFCRQVRMASLHCHIFYLALSHGKTFMIPSLLKKVLTS